jgi:hypothetical protein
MEPEGSLSWSQVRVTGHYSEPYVTSDVARPLVAGGRGGLQMGGGGCCEYMEYAVADSLQGVVLQLVGWCGADNFPP